MPSQAAVTNVLSSLISMDNEHFAASIGFVSKL